MHNYNTQLCIELQSSRLLFGTYNHDSGEKKLIHNVEIDFSDSDKESSVASVFDQIPELKNDYKEYTFSVSNQKCTLAPIPVFNASKAEDIFHFNFAAKDGAVDYNRIPELNLAVVYEMQDLIKRKLIIKAPRTRIYHQTSVILKAIASDNIYKPKVYLNVNESFFQLFIIHKKELIFYNAFDYQNHNDIVYHLLFVLEQKEISTDTIALKLTGTVENGELASYLQKYFKQPFEFEANNNEHFALFSQFLCA